MKAQRTIPAAPHGSDVTDREVQVIEAISHGASNDEIAEALGVSVNTVKTILRRALARLNARDRGHAACIGLRQGWIR